MGVRILYTTTGDMACMYDSVSMTAFGPVFSGLDADDQATHFLDWLSTDPRMLTPVELEAEHKTWAGRNLDDEGELTAAAARHVLELL
jgi:hypothetical protein